ncbi:MAG: MBL fold metallo-hydrolase [Burkholderiaceae bacterium]|jgi:glyoxylase-like metal-dependent hydrolase (beta-lactamase superfamily II)|nr:MBL fold metallo-hydrolase [Aquabacterium sp.]NUP85534.1 MBL fold metallo-hydrolase [Burkholderiaceae bacterium]
MLPEFVEALGGGVFAIDTGFTRPRFDAAYLIVHEGRAAFVDSGTNFSVPRLLAALDAVGIARDAVDWVIPTHVHLDHAGGVGLLMQHLNKAAVLVHERGVRHMVDPRALYQGALAVYGAQEMQRSYGELQPIDANRVRATHEGMVVELAGRPLRFADTPGHARHHHCIWDEHTRGWFTGDTFGLSYREYDTADGAWITPTTTPVQFEPDPLRQSIDRLVARDPQCMYLTHYSRVRDIPRLASLLHEQIDALVALAEPLRGHPDRHRALCEQLRVFYRAQLSRHGVADVEAGVQALALDTELNAQGLAVWLDRARNG